MLSTKISIKHLISIKQTNGVCFREISLFNLPRQIIFTVIISEIINVIDIDGVASCILQLTNKRMCISQWLNCAQNNTFQPAKLQKNSVEECIFHYIALQIECQFNQNSLLLSYFTAFLLAVFNQKGRPFNTYFVN